MGYPYQGYTPQSNASLLQGYQQRYDRAMGDLQGLGQAEAADLREQYQAAQSAGMQDLANRGITSSTILPSMRMGYQRQLDRSMSALHERLRRERMGYQAQMSSDLLEAQERDQTRQMQESLAWGNWDLDRLRTAYSAPTTGFRMNTSYSSPQLGSSFRLQRS